jgi:MFS family permease
VGGAAFIPKLLRVLPDTRGRRRLVIASAVDTLGVGLFLPLSMYFFTVSTTLPIAGIGATISAATLGALLTAPWAGALTDRFGARDVAVLSNLLTAAGYVSYVFVHNYAELFAAVFVVMTGDRFYFAAWPTLIAEVSGESERDSWYALIQTAAAGSLGIGALLSGLLLARQVAHALDTLIVINSLTSVLAAALTRSLRRPSPPHRQAQRQPAAAGTFVVFHDRRFVRLLTGQALIATAWTLPGTFLPLYLAGYLKLPAWYAMALFSLNYLILFAFQLVLTSLIRNVRRTRAVATGAFCFIVTSAMLALAPLAGRNLTFTVIAAGIVIYSVGEMLCVPAANAMVAAHARAAVRGRYMAMFQLTGAVAFGLGPAFVGVLFALDPRLVLLVVALSVSLGGFATLSSDWALDPGR